MNSLLSINSFYNKPNKHVYTYLSVLNGNFTSPTVASGGQTSLTTTTQLTSWSMDNLGSNVRILNNLLNDNASPYSYNATLLDGTSEKTVLFIAQANGAQTTNISQNISFSNTNTYTISFWAAPRKVYYNSSQSLSLYVNGVLMTLNGSLSNVTFTSGTSTQPFVNYTTSFTPSTAGTYSIDFRWTATQTVDSTIMLTGIQIYQ